VRKQESHYRWSQSNHYNIDKRRRQNFDKIHIDHERMCDRRILIDAEEFHHQIRQVLQLNDALVRTEREEQTSMMCDRQELVSQSLRKHQCEQMNYLLGQKQGKVNVCTTNEQKEDVQSLLQPI